jgi:hypothetical protein
MRGGKFKEKFNEILQFFELLFRVTGIDKTVYIRNY